jgi:hypothetical protein
MRAEYATGLGQARPDRARRHVIVQPASPEVLDEGVEHLRADLDTGRRDERYGHLRSMTEADYGYKLVIAGG